MLRTGFWLIIWGCATTVCAAEASPRTLDFTRDIRPILSNHCWNCHGPDEASRKGGLRLDLREVATSAADSGEIAIVPQQPDHSELIRRIIADDDSVMPPHETQKPLSPVQKELLRRWIAEGAEFSPHWAFQAPQRPALPTVQQATWPRNPIDQFILQRLEHEQLAPSPESDRATWLRRVTLDLTGLPPTLAEQTAYLQDAAPQAEERVVDRLLESPAHAERMAMSWLDAARYADTNGYNNDEVRSMWPWRDWLINAYAQGMPYDQFLIEQLAGDLLPDASLSQKVATGFNRNHVLTTEGGIIEEEYHVEYVADRIHTTSSVFLGLSVQCARCHDHKFDPITQHEYYQFAAFFNNVPDRIVGYSQGRMAEPLLKVPSPAQQARKQELTIQQTDLAQRLEQRARHCAADLTAWERRLTPEQVAQTGPAGLVAHFPLDEADGASVTNAITESQPATIQGTVTRAPGKIGGAIRLDGSNYISSENTGDFEADQPFSMAAWIQVDTNEPSTVLSKIDEGAAFRGYDLIIEAGKVATHIVHHWPDKAFKVQTKTPISLKEWHHVIVSYNGSRAALGITIFIDGQPQPLDITTDNRVEGTLHTDKPFHIGRRTSSAPFKGLVDDVQLYNVALSPEDAATLAHEKSLSTLAKILALPETERTPTQQAQVRDYFLRHVDAESRTLRTDLARIPQQLTELDAAIPVTMVMQEQTPRRPSYLLKRGQYDQRGEAVPPGVPQALGAPRTEISTRLDLARWMTSPEHPLVARVAVNRSWELFFGTGLVETVEDFGVQGSPPSHPQLLDWLATELIQNGWNQRAILKQIVLSATYRQQSATTPELLERDPHNRLLARGPRYRLPVEMVRDNALSISGLLAQRIGGPSVKPYQPAGLWEDVSVERRDKYVPDTGEGLYRRSMYTFWKRTSPPPSMTAFDAPDRETCLLRRSRTNTPLQALVLLNDPTYVEAARVFAQRLLTENSDDSIRASNAWQRALCRRPRPEEITIALQILQTARTHFAEHPDAAGQLIHVGHAPVPEQFPPHELAAWTTLTSLILNLDEAISKR